MLIMACSNTGKQLFELQDLPFYFCIFILSLERTFWAVISLFWMPWINEAWVTYRFSYAVRHNDANKMTPPLTPHTHTHTHTPTPCLMRHFQSFYNINSFLKRVLNIFILRSLVAEWEEGVIKEGACIYHQIWE